MEIKARAAATFTDDVVGVIVAADVEAVAKEAAKAAGKGVSASGSDASGSADASRPTISEVAATQEVIQRGLVTLKGRPIAQQKVLLQKMRWLWWRVQFCCEDMSVIWLAQKAGAGAFGRKY